MAFLDHMHEARIDLNDAAIRGEVDRLLALVSPPGKATPWRQRLYDLQEEGRRLPGAYILRVGGNADGSLEEWDSFRYVLRPYIPGYASLAPEDEPNDVVIGYEVVKACEMAGVDFIELYLQAHPTTDQQDVESYVEDLYAHPGIHEQILFPRCPLETLLVLVLFDMKTTDWKELVPGMVEALGRRGLALRDWEERVKNVREMALGQYGLSLTK